MDDIRKLQLAVLKRLLIVDIALIIITVIVSDEPLPFIYGLIFGSAISGLNFMELASTLKRAVQMPSARAQSFTTRKYFMRYIVSAVVIYISIVAPYINILGTILGMTIIKLVIFATNLFNDKHYYKKIFKRKEDESSGH